MQTTLDPARLSNLRDIVEPPPIPWWPPAPGWYVVLAVLIGGACVGTYLWVRRWKANWYRRAALAKLQQLASDPTMRQTPRRMLCEVQELLKRTALVAFPREQVAPLTDNRWLEFLDRTSGMQEFTGGSGRRLIEAVYAPNSADRLTIADTDSVLQLSRSWIERHRITLTPE